MDFRLTKAIHGWMENMNILNDCDVISIAGVVKAIARDKDSAESKYILSQIGLSKKLHQIQTIYLIHHTDCGAYGGHEAFNDLEQEKSRHIEDMNISKVVIEELVSDVEVKLVLADMKPDGRIDVIMF